MAALTAILQARRQAAIDRAERVAAGFSDHRSAGMEQQLELEQAIEDADRYERMLTSVGGAVIRREAGPYHKDGEHSFFADVAEVAQYGNGAAPDTAARLQRLRAMNEDVRNIEARDIGSGTVTGTAMPSYLLEEAATAARIGSPLIEVLRGTPLDHEGMQVVIGRITTGATAAFTPEGSGTESAEMVSTALTLDVKFVQGKVTETWTLFQRARRTTDLVVARDLGEAVAFAAENAVINGAGGPVNPIGILQTSGITATTYTDATPTAAELVQKIAACATSATTARKRRPTLIVMHSRRWFWICSQADTALQPIVEISTEPPLPDGPYVGTIAGLPVVLADAIPTTVGGDQDQIILIRVSDLLLAIDDRHMQVEAMIQMPNVDVWAGEYLVFTAGRYPSGVGVLSGTGLNAVAT